jgi:hypothetical protein
MEDVGMYILWLFGIFCGHLAYFEAIWHILWPFGIFIFTIFSPVLVCCAESQSGNPASARSNGFLSIHK